MMRGAWFVLFELLLALICCCCRHVEPSSSVFIRQFSQTTVELFPCEELPSTVSLYSSTLITVMANLSLCEHTNKINATVSRSIAVNLPTHFIYVTVYYNRKLLRSRALLYKHFMAYSSVGHSLSSIMHRSITS